jgi:beta-galactosidase
MRWINSFLLSLFMTVLNSALAADEVFTPPLSPHVIYSFNSGWKFIREDVTNAWQSTCNDLTWTTVSAPHTYNETDSYTDFISHSGGDRHAYAGIAWYRKHFKLPANARDGKVILELEGMKQAGRFWVNGKFAGRFENGITAFGLDLTEFVNFGEAENVIAIKVDNSNDYLEEATGVGYEWMGRAFNPNYGGLNHDIWLHLTGRIYQTLPIYENLKTTGIYVFPSDFSISNKTCIVNMESQVRNESGEPQSIIFSAVIVDDRGKVCAQFQGDPSDLVNGQTEVFSGSIKLSGVKFWSDAEPILYDVYCILTSNDKVVDVQKIRTGFRKSEFKGGIGTGGIYLNDRFVWLTGYAQRSTDDWAGLGQAYPDWMHDFNADMIRSSHANFIRWMHVSPQAVDVRACDRAGIVEICPAGDKEGDPALDKRLTPATASRQWEQRMEVMRDSIIFFRNNPSILFWEAGNNGVTPAHMKQMVDLRRQFDPGGGRVMGCRTLNDPEATPIAEYFGVMIGQDRRTDALTNRTELFRAYSAERRDLAPFIETEDFRDEAARRYWDDASPPHFGFKKGVNDVYDLNSETFCLAAAERYHEYFINRICNTNGAHSKWAGYTSIYWSDSNADGRQNSSEVCRVSGKVDSVRLPKQAYYTYRVMQSYVPDIHIIGHWNYPTNTLKTIYIAANHCDSVELFINGKSMGKVNTPTNGYIFSFPKIIFEPGIIQAVAKASGKIVAVDVIETSGTAKAIKLTTHTGPKQLQADAADVVLIDVEVVDAKGRRCPTDEARVNFNLVGPAIWRGGYNSGKAKSVNNLWLDTECGINRIAIRSTLKAGQITLTASREGLESASVTFKSIPVETGGL